MRRGFVVRAAVVLLALGLASCEWATFQGGAARSGWQASESAIGVGNVSQLAPVRSYPGASSPPVVAGGVLYSLAGTGTLQAFDTNGSSNCTGSPTVCTPLWTAAGAGRSVTVHGGKVYAVGTWGLRVFDAKGSDNCGGSPKVCAPLWTTGTFTNTGRGSPAVVDGVVYVTGDRSIHAAPGNAYVIAYDANGSTNCTGTVCSPLWWSTAAPGDVSYDQALAVANGVVYATTGSLVWSAEANKVLAFDATGSSNCGGSPKVCAPLWSASPPTPLAYSGPSVGNGTVFVAGYGGTLYAYDAAGTNGCSGSPKTCAPLWTASVGDTRSTAAVANGTVYVKNATGVLGAFDATTATGCSGDPKVCTPLWTYDAPGSASGSPIVANGVVYASSTSDLHALDAAGSIGCSGTPKTCSPLWSAGTGSSNRSPAIVNGTVFLNREGTNDTWAYRLPGGS
jgi:hypothetical protein